MNPGNFRSSVRRSIAFRVGMTAILLGAIFAGITAVTERQRMEEGVVALVFEPVEYRVWTGDRARTAADERHAVRDWPESHEC